MTPLFPNHRVAPVAASNNHSAARTRIRDVDAAEQTVLLSRNRILVQASVAVLAQTSQRVPIWPRSRVPQS